jgi:hypothetical protein
MAKTDNSDAEMLLIMQDIDRVLSLRAATLPQVLAVADRLIVAAMADVAAQSGSVQALSVTDSVLRDIRTRVLEQILQ